MLCSSASFFLQTPQSFDQKKRKGPLNLDYEWETGYTNHIVSIKVEEVS